MLQFAPIPSAEIPIQNCECYRFPYFFTYCSYATFPSGLLGVLTMIAFALELNLLASSSGSRTQSALDVLAPNLVWKTTVSQLITRISILYLTYLSKILKNTCRKGMYTGIPPASLTIGT